MRKLTIFYDNWCPNCTTFIKTVKKLDWLNLLDEKKLRDSSDTFRFSNLNITLAREQMASYRKNKWNYGFVSIYRIFLIIPAFWIFVPLFFILNITGLGQYFYKELALKRKIIPLHCDEKSCNIS